MENSRPVTPTDIRMNETPEVDSRADVSLTLNSDPKLVTEATTEDVWTEEQVQTLKHIADLDQTWEQVRQLVLRLFPNHDEATMRYRWQHFRRDLTDSIELLTTPSTPETNRKRKAPSSAIEVVTPAPTRRRLDSDDTHSTPIPYQLSLTTLMSAMPMPENEKAPVWMNSNVSTETAKAQLKSPGILSCPDCGSRVQRRKMSRHRNTPKCKYLTQLFQYAKDAHSRAAMSKEHTTFEVKPNASRANTSPLFKPITATPAHARPISSRIITTGSIKPVSAQDRGPSTADSTFMEIFEVLHAEGFATSTAVDDDDAAAFSEYVPPSFTSINAALAPVKPLTLFQDRPDGSVAPPSSRAESSENVSPSFTSINTAPAAVQPLTLFEQHPDGSVAPPASPADPSEIARFRVFETETNENVKTSDADEADERDGFDDLEELMRRMQDEGEAVFFIDEDEQSTSVPMSDQSQPAAWNRQHDYILRMLVRRGHSLEVVKDKHFAHFSLQEVWAKYDNAKRRYDKAEASTKKGSSLHWVEPEPHRLAAQADADVRFRPQTFVSNIKSNMEEIYRI